MRIRFPFGVFGATALSLAAIWLLLDTLLPWLAMIIDAKPHPLPIPVSGWVMYAVVVALGIYFYVTSDDRRLAAFKEPVTALFEPPQTRWQGIWRRGLLAAIPAWAAWLGFCLAKPEAGELSGARIQHPPLPPAFEKRENPIRKLPPEKFQEALAEGRVLFETNCRACHGDWAGGDGPMARGFRLKPANFTDPGTIATVVEAYPFWRIKEGGPGLAASATPWDSAMPSWKDDLTDEEIWKIITAEYDLAGVEPRKPEKIH